MKLRNSMLLSAFVALPVFSTSSFADTFDLAQMYESATSYDADLAAARSAFQAVQEQEDGQIGLFVDDAKVVHGFALAGACAVERQKWLDRISQGYVHAEEGEAL